MRTKPYCQHCKTTEGVMMVISRRKNGDIYHMCRKCNTDRCKGYRETPKGRKIVQKAVYKSTAKHQEKQNARLTLNRYVKEGRITKPKKCSVCKQEKRIEGHHSDHTKPLKVKWVCRQCHADIHRKTVIHK